MNRHSPPIHPFGGENAVRKKPGLVDILQAAKLRKTAEIKEDYLYSTKGIVPTEMELVLEYTQQGASHEVS
ncbi:hypothetical protein Tco_1085332, partial [Tanacetum coccineum]